MLGFSPIAGSTLSGVGATLTTFTSGDLTSANITINTATGKPVLTPDVQSFANDNITVQINILTPPMVQTNNLASPDIVANSIITTLALDFQTHNLTSDNLAIDTITGNPVITQDHNLSQDKLTVSIILGDIRFPFNIIEIPPTEFTQFFPQVPDYGDATSPSDFWTEQTDNITDSNWIEQQSIDLSNTWTEQ